MHRNVFLIFVATAVLFHAAAALVFGLDRPLYSDEKHYIPAIRGFAGAVTIEKLRDYPEAIGPLSFVVYAKIGDVVGFETWKLRAVSLTLSLAAVLLFQAAVARATRRPWLAFAAAAAVMTSPYMVRMSLLVFTDMLPMVLLAGWLWFVARDRAWPAALCAAAMLLCRQYYGFLLPAAALFYAGRAAVRADHRGRDLAAAAAQAVAFVPYGLLVLLWGGLMPPGGRFWVLPDEPLCHPGFLTAFVVMTAVYAAPLLMWRWRMIYGSWRSWSGWRLGLSAAALMGWYAAFPVRLSRIAAERHSDAVGSFHRFAQLVSGGRWEIEHAILFAVFALGVPVLAWLVRDAWRLARAKRLDLALLVDLALLAFYLVMPLSYNVWEKYFLPALMLLSLRLAMGEEPDEGPAGVRDPITPPTPAACGSARA